MLLYLVMNFISTYMLGYYSVMAANGEDFDRTDEVFVFVSGWAWLNSMMMLVYKFMELNQWN